MSGASSSPADAAAFRGLRAVLVVPEARTASRLSVQAGLVATRLQLDGARVTRVDVPAGTAGRVRDVVRNARFRGRMRRALEAGADAVVVHAAPGRPNLCATAAALALSREAGVTAVLRWDGAEPGRRLASDPEPIRSVLSCADEIVVPSRELRDVLDARLGIAATVIPNLVEDAGIEEPPVRAAGRLRLLSASHLVRGCGVDIVIAAASRALRLGADLELVVAGDGPERAALERIAARDLPGRVAFLGAAPRHDVLARLRETDLVVNAGADDDFPVGIEDALAAGVPVAATAFGEAHAVVEHGATGLVTAAWDAEALAGSIARLGADRVALVQFGWQAKIGALRWNWDALRGCWARVLLGGVPA